MSLTRRKFLSLTGTFGASLALGCASTTGDGPPSRPAFSTSLAEWSFHRALQSGRMTNLDFPVRARREFGIGAVEYVNSFMKDRARDAGYLKELMTRCDGEGVRSLLIMCDGEGDLGHEDTAARLKAIQNHEKWLDCAAVLGCHSIRVNAGGRGTRKDVAQRAADSLVRLATYADGSRLNVIVENHGGYSSDGSWLAGVMKIANHPRVGTLPDFGNFALGDNKSYDRYLGVEEMMPFAKAVSAKSHAFNANGDETSTNYTRMMGIVLAAGYRGFVGIEYEGDRHSEDDGVRLTKSLLERVREDLGSRREE